MTSRRRSWLLLVPTAIAGALLASWGSSPAASGDTPPPSPAAGDQPDESLLGTIEVNGSAGLPPLPKMGVVPIVPSGTADSLVNLVVRHDMELSGQFDVLGEDTAPIGPFTHTDADRPRRVAREGRRVRFSASMPSRRRPTPRKPNSSAKRI